MRVRVQTEAFDAGVELAAFSGGLSDVGAVVSFTGLVRQSPEGDLIALEIEHYPGMTERALKDLRQQAITRFELSDALLIHRYGRLVLSEPIVMVATASPHREAAFKGADFLMDTLKSNAPFWKKEIRKAGEAWVEAHGRDAKALKRWESS
ncbi:MAG: molybdenum cofactor biosynthesis protein MoaE [Pseudomonadota bacterium]